MKQGINTEATRAEDERHPDGSGHSAKPEPASRLGHTASVPDACYSHLSEDDFDYDLGDCWNCGGEGWVYGCSWDWQCDTYDDGEGTCLCTRPCHFCFPPRPDPELDRILAQAIEARSGETERLDPKGESAVAESDAPEADPVHSQAAKRRGR